MFSIEGIIADTGKRKHLEIDVTSGLFTKISEPIGKADVVLRDELIFPGFVDLHVHAREDASHAQDYKENFHTASLSAINGGVVAFMEMPNNPVPPVDDESYRIKKELTKSSKIEVVLYAGIGNGTKPLSTSVPYKVYMGPSVGDLFFKTLEELEQTLVLYEGSCVSFHCEDPKILDENKNVSLHEDRRPRQAEYKAIDFALLMIEKYNLFGKICHCSTREGIEKIKNAKDRGVKVTAEVSPHHLYYDTDILTAENRNWMQMNPPLRTHADKDYLIQALKDGVIDFLATDHAPHTKEEKLKGVSGTPQLDTYGLVVSLLIKEHNFTPQEIVRVCSKNPGDFISQFTANKYGAIEIGYVGSLSILDLNKKTKVTEDILKTKCGWSPFIGIEFPGAVSMTIIKGKIYEEYNFHESI